MTSIFPLHDHICYCFKCVFIQCSSHFLCESKLIVKTRISTKHILQSTPKIYNSFVLL
uniref:Uncharacterized protein n=1 Tax=Solanum lycopersicum TaxID=4081 RepID=A0A3Q7JC90_SOLLC